MTTPEPKSAIDLLASHALTKDMGERALTELASRMEAHTFASDEAILEVGQKNDRIHFIASGSVAVEAEDSDATKHRIATLQAGEAFGEMSLIDDAPVSARVRALESVDLFILDGEALAANPEVQLTLTRSIAGLVTQRLRLRSTDLADSLAEQLRAAELRNRFGQFYVLTMALYLIAGVQTSGVAVGFAAQMRAVWLYLLLLLVPVLIFIRWQKIPLSSFGLTREGIGPAIREGLAVTVVAGAIFAVIRYSTLAPNEAFFSWSKSLDLQPHAWLFSLLYLPHSFIQEFVARGVMQGSLKEFMSDQKTIIPVTLAAFLFSTAHMHLGWLAVLLTFIISFVLGMLYQRHGNLAGVTAVHFFLGLGAIAVGWI